MIDYKINPVHHGRYISSGKKEGGEREVVKEEIFSWIDDQGRQYRLNPEQIANKTPGSLCKVFPREDIFFIVLPSIVDGWNITPLVKRLTPDEARQEIKRLGLRNEDYVDVVKGVPLNPR